MLSRLSIGFADKRTKADGKQQQQRGMYHRRSNDRFGFKFNRLKYPCHNLSIIMMWI
ncbi:MAG: hypothetical protein SPI30_04580 [Prevotella sp.]|nr:hypothetical protein [Prevotella sp.]